MIDGGAGFRITGGLVHNGGVTGNPTDPCGRHECHRCCVGTRMTLTEADVARLEGAGHREFFRHNRDGDLELRNRRGCCVFLEGGRCSVYAERPEGCRLYPLVLDLGSDRVVRDDFCPHHDEFPVLAAAVASLRRSVAREAVEAGRRRRGGHG